MTGTPAGRGKKTTALAGKPQDELSGTTWVSLLNFREYKEQEAFAE